MGPKFDFFNYKFHRRYSLISFKEFHNSSSSFLTVEIHKIPRKELQAPNPQILLPLPIISLPFPLLAKTKPSSMIWSSPFSPFPLPRHHKFTTLSHIRLSLWSFTSSSYRRRSSSSCTLTGCCATSPPPAPVRHHSFRDATGKSPPQLQYKFQVLEFSLSIISCSFVCFPRACRLLRSFPAILLDHVR